jgi:hypothetical protein
VILTPKWAAPSNAGGARKDLLVETRAMRHASADDDEYSAAPDPYAPGLAKLRSATSTPESRFEEQWKAERFAEVERFAELVGEHRFPRLSDDELKAYAPPDPYAAGLRAIKEARR